jgi:hypothetical protein
VRWRSSKATSMANTPCGMESERILSVINCASSCALFDAERAAAGRLQRQLMVFYHGLAKGFQRARAVVQQPLLFQQSLIKCGSSSG